MSETANMSEHLEEENDKVQHWPESASKYHLNLGTQKSNRENKIQGRHEDKREITAF